MFPADFPGAQERVPVFDGGGLPLRGAVRQHDRRPFHPGVFTPSILITYVCHTLLLASRPSIFITPVFWRHVLASRSAIVVASVCCTVVVITGPAARPRTSSSGCVYALLFSSRTCVTLFYWRHVLIFLSRLSIVVTSLHHVLLVSSRPCIIRW